MSETVNLDGKEYLVDEMSDEARDNFLSLKLVDQRLTETQHTLAILQTARIAYGKALKRLLEEDDSGAPDVSIDKYVVRS